MRKNEGDLDLLVGTQNFASTASLKKSPHCELTSLQVRVNESLR